MIRTTKNSARLLNNTSSDQESKMQAINQQPSTSQVQHVLDMYMPYIEGPKMDWTVNDGLYHRLLKWKLKCENILDCELAMLPDSKLQESYIAWSGIYLFVLKRYVTSVDYCIIWNGIVEVV